MKNLIIKLQKISRFFIGSIIFGMLLLTITTLYYITYKSYSFEGILYLTFFLLFNFFIALGFIPTYKEKSK